MRILCCHRKTQPRLHIGRRARDNYYVNIGRMDYDTWNSASIYHALQAEVIKRLSRGLQVQGSYTWSRSIDTSSATGVPDPFQNSITSLFFFDQRLHRGPSDCAKSIGELHMARSAPRSLQKPTRMGTQRLASPVNLTEPTRALDFTPLISGDTKLRNTDPFDYPNFLSTTPGCHNPTNPGSANANDYLKLSCFALPVATPDISKLCRAFSAAPGTCANLVGNTGRNSVIGPGLVDFDFSLFKNNYITKISETFNAQFRVESFNIFNHTNFGPLPSHEQPAFLM